MAAYATVADIQSRFYRAMTEDEQKLCTALLDDASVVIDTFAQEARAAAKKTVSCNMVLRAIGSGIGLDIPIGATQASQGALGYNQSWTISGGGAGELYLTKLDKQLLGYGNKIGSASPVEALVHREEEWCGR